MMHWVDLDGNIACGAYGVYGKVWAEVQHADCTTEPEQVTCERCKSEIVDRTLDDDDFGGIKAASWDSVAGSVGLARMPGERSSELRARLVAFMKEHGR